ncbi:hypothetical protein C5708_18235 [Caulobacter sp. CCUG 60055]|nr:hypothetical protein [Caulobacter sp. CCUG 60055]MBQ1541191.1 hypothetical protein [Caulobacteraceae bacterium]MCI3182186.1 hypothetical protein [Caulobacter sp. CCUG 60055]
MKISPEDRRAIDEALAAGRVTYAPPGYAAGLTVIEAITGVIAPPDHDPAFTGAAARQATGKADAPRRRSTASSRAGRPPGEITVALLAMEVGQSLVFASERAPEHIKTATRRRPERRWTRTRTPAGYRIQRTA